MTKSMWTYEQLLAIETSNKNMLVSAGAGCGKTSVLVERIIKKITRLENPINIDELLIMTFTNAAAAEMKERIRKALYKKVSLEPNNSHLIKQLILINKAHITTIHAFCSDIIKNNFNMLDIDPGFSICDESKQSLLKKIAIEEVLENEYELNEESFINVVNSIGYGSDEGKLIETIYNIHKKIMSIPKPEEWLVNKSKLYDAYTNLFETFYGEMLFNYTNELLISINKEYIKIVELTCDDDTLLGYYNTIFDENKSIENFLKVLEDKSYNEFYTIINSFKFDRIGRCSKDADKLITDHVKEVRNDIKKTFKELMGLYIHTQEESLDINASLSPIIKKLSNLVISFKNVYDKKKNEKGQLDYNDLEHLCLLCLDKGANIGYREMFEEILIDEYQDSNLVQEELINYIKKDNNLFMVGDIKQSIYRFREATPALFLDKFNSYSQDVNSKNLRIGLYKNFRSRFEVLNLVNRIFYKILSKESGDIEYNEEEKLNLGATYNDNGFTNEILITEGENQSLFNRSMKKEEKEAISISHKILELVNGNEKITDKNTGEIRNIRYSDIVILLRSVSTIGASYIKTLKSFNIPVFADEKDKFFDDYNVSLLISYIAILDNPYQDIPLLAIMRSDFFNFSDQEIALIKTKKNKFNSLYDSVNDYNIDNVILEKIIFMKEQFNKYNKLKSLMPINKLIWEISTNSGFYYQYNEEIKRKQGNIRRLYEIAMEYEKNTTTSLFDFLVYIKEHKEGASDLVGAKTFGESDDVIRIMTIHKSKGLEFPIVILGSAHKQFNINDSKERVLVDNSLGLGCDYVNYEKNYLFPTLAKKLISINKKEEGKKEEIRMLYVALTRSREKLIISGYVNNIEKSQEKWEKDFVEYNEKFSKNVILKSSCYLDWIMYAVKNYEKNLEVTYIDSIKLYDLNQSIVRKENDSKEFNELDYETINKNFKWSYKYKNEESLYRKISVTELKKLRNLDLDVDVTDIFNSRELNIPEFITDDKQLTAAQKGTLIHNYLASIDFNKANIDNNYLIDTIQDEKIVKYINDFIISSLGKRLLKSNKYYREKNFIMPVLTSYIYPNLKEKISANHKTLLQGIIDCIFIENGEAVLIDYKTDNVTLATCNEKAEKYKIQIDSYAKYIEDYMKLNVKEKYVYFLKIDKAILM